MNSLPLAAACDRSTVQIAVAPIWLGHERKLRNFIQKRVLNREDAEDLLQLTYLEGWRNQGHFNGQASVETWLCGIALNLIRNHFRRFYAQPQHSQLDEQDCQEHDGNLDPSAQTECHRLLERTLNAMSCLPREMRDTLRVAIETEGSYCDIAQTLGVPIGTVRSRLSRAREQLKRNVYQEAHA